MRLFKEDADLGERTEEKGRLMTSPKQAYAGSKVTNWQQLERDVWRMSICLASTTTLQSSASFTLYLLQKMFH